MHAASFYYIQKPNAEIELCARRAFEVIAQKSIAAHARTLHTHIIYLFAAFPEAKRAYGAGSRFSATKSAARLARIYFAISLLPFKAPC